MSFKDQKLNDSLFEEEVEKFLKIFIENVLSIRSESNYKVIFAVNIINTETGDRIEIIRG